METHVIDRQEISQALSCTIDSVPFDRAAKFAGKVRDNFALGDARMAIVVTDRVSVFDFGIGTVPFKGQILNRLAAWWFGKLDDIDIPHHHIGTPHPNVSLVRRATPLPIEFVVRAYLTGSTTTSSWYAYQNNHREICGIRMPAGMKKNEPFPGLLVTPATKASKGHDENISLADIVERDLVDREVLALAERYALAMFRHGQKLARERGLILVDTKYEMGLADDGSLIVIDEVHTPDSSRYWIADTYEDRMRGGQEPDSLDKEFVRRLVVQAGYDVDSDDDPARYFSDEMRIDAAVKYIDLFARMTGSTARLAISSTPEIVKTLESLISTPVN